MGMRPRLTISSIYLLAIADRQSQKEKKHLLRNTVLTPTQVDGLPRYLYNNENIATQSKTHILE